MTSSLVAHIIQDESGLIERTENGYKCRACAAEGSSPQAIRHSMRCSLMRLMGRTGVMELARELYATPRTGRSTVSLI